MGGRGHVMAHEAITCLDPCDRNKKRLAKVRRDDGDQG